MRRIVGPSNRENWLNPMISKRPERRRNAECRSCSEGPHEPETTQLRSQRNPLHGMRSTTCDAAAEAAVKTRAAWFAVAERKYTEWTLPASKFRKAGRIRGGDIRENESPMTESDGLKERCL